MATLNAMFKILDGYSGPLGTVIKRSDEATNKILKASGATDSLNNKLRSTGASANIGASGIGNYVKAIVSIAGAIKGMNIVDTYINTQARLNLINDGLQTQAELQNKIFAAADRSRGAYSSMAAAISKMGILAGDAFGSNDEIINFTELLQKSFRIGGSSTQEQSAGMYQLTQAMAAGKLQGDEFRSIMENAPMLAQAIADFTGKSKGELKKMSAEGTITADIIKGALFAASDDINAQFEKMPKTFGDVWNKIKNGGVQAFSGIMESVNRLVNTNGFDNMINGLIGGMYAVANTIQWIIDMTTKYMDYIAPILETIGGVLLVAIIQRTWAIAAASWAAVVPWLVAHGAILLVVAAIVLVANVLGAMGITASDVFGYIGGGIGVLIAWFKNLGATVYNAFIFVIKSIDDMITSCVNNAISAINLIIKALNKIPGVEIELVNKLDNSFGNLKYQKLTSYADAYKAGSQIGKNAYGAISDKISGLMGGKDDIGTATNPLTVQGAGANGSLKVDMSDEDIQYLRDIAERDYINKFSSKTLAPQIQVTFGDVHKEADADEVAGRIRQILQEEIATASEGAYEG